MTIRYIDTSAAMKLLIVEQESRALHRHLQNIDNRTLVASWLLHTELHCAAARHPQSISGDDVSAVLDRILLVDVVRSDLIVAGGLERLRTNDAIHLATAIRINADELIAYDNELLAAAVRRGIRRSSPGQPE